MECGLGVGGCGMGYGAGVHVRSGGHKGVQSGGCGVQVPQLHITPGDLCIGG